MSFVEDLFSILYFSKIGGKFWVYSDSVLQNLSQSMSNMTCDSIDVGLDGCRNESYALILKLIAIAAILITGVCGVAIPLVGKECRFFRTDSNFFVVAKAFAAGVILATGFVHMLPDATSSLTDPCLPKFPWSEFPFSGFIAMMAALATLLAEFIGTQYYARRQEKQNHSVQADSLDLISESSIVPVERREGDETVFGEEEGGAMHIVGMHAHVAHHRHSHSQEKGACEGHSSSHGHSHSHGIGGGDEDGGVRHVVVSQVLELGIVSHSIIIGLSLGVSHSPCTIRPLIGALSFHQFFEGIAVSSSYNPKSSRALVVEGIFDSISAGILVYMALVDLIAADLLSKKMSCKVRLQLLKNDPILFQFCGVDVTYQRKPFRKRTFIAEKRSYPISVLRC
ncbi:unnamed protein product [Fraxinus pennsylvanica]|uniref:Uncharacterized protein n=1 Tax=Fraxinus pennsylvanica TaxID=56036 RepID=A0AAD2AF34_9LAMI|nr:unnamed protein product [Fraxinus pennsylvanica]